MPDWNGICCAIDFSEPARLAMNQAADLARCLGASLTLVYVHEPPRSPAATDLLAPGREAAELEAAEIERALAAWRTEAARMREGEVDARVLVGSPGAEIARFAREQGCDLVVLGTHGRTGLKRLVLGSVAEQVVRQAPCPVLVVRSREPVGIAAEATERA